MNQKCFDQLSKEVSQDVLTSHMNDKISIRGYSEYTSLNNSCISISDIFHFEASAKKMLNNKSDFISHIMIVFGIDNFKEINESYGYAVGNELLSYVQIILNSNIEKPHLYCQLYSDSFAIFLENYKDIDLALLTIQLTEEISSYHIDIKPKLSFGICKATTSDLNIPSLCGRALYARRTIKTDAGQLMADYHEIAHA
jgi:diguanylate cyclase (GGDEF)-like protein